MKQMHHTLRLDTIVGGGQAMGTLDDGRRAFVWGGLPGELVTIRVTKKKSKFIEGVVTEVYEPSPERIAPRDPDSYLSTSPWQIMRFDTEQHYKAALIEEAFELHNIVLPDQIEVYSDGVEYGYRNKVEFSFFGQKSTMNDEWRMTNDAVTSQHAVRHPGLDTGSSKIDRLDAGSESGMTERDDVTLSAPAAQLTTRPEKGINRSVTVASQMQSHPSLPASGDSAFPAEASQDKLADGDERAPGDGSDERARGEWKHGLNGDMDEKTEKLDLAFFRRGSKGKIPVDGTSLAHPSINQLARAIRDRLQAAGISARQLKTLLIRSDQAGNCVWQLYVRDRTLDWKNILHHKLDMQGSDLCMGGEVIYSDPRSPASRITERLASIGDIVLEDRVLDVPFRYATEGFFQVNIPVYEQALRDMREWLVPSRSKQEVVSSKETSQQTASASTPARVARGGAAPAFDKISDFSKEGADRVAGPEDSDLRGEHAGTARAGDDGSGGERGGWMPNQVRDDDNREPLPTIDMYSGVGTIGLTIGGDNCTLIEIDANAVREMRRNITELGSSATAVLAPSEKALEYIVSDHIVIVDPPRAGLHADVVARLLETQPPRIIYLSCNPVTQARDIALLCASGVYGIRAHRGYNFFPRTPHIEHLVVLDKI